MKPAVLAWLLLVAAAFAVAGCDADQENPYDRDDEFVVDWPSGDPNRYHWDGLADPFFEGWFFRVVAPGGRAYAFLYAVQNPGAVDAGEGGAYVVAARAGGDLRREAFSVEDFSADRQSFDVEIEGNVARPTRLRGTLRGAGDEIAWDLRVEAHESWDDTMGTLTNVPLLPVNWHVGVLRGSADGWIEWAGQREELEDAPVFQDHNWGDVFPERYIWLQSAEFTDPEDALALSGGDVGFAAGMFVWRHDGRRIELRTQDLGTSFRFSPSAETGRIDVEVDSGSFRYVVTGFLAGDEPVLFPAPRPEGFVPFTHLALAGRLRVRSFIRDGVDWRLVEEVWSKTAGVEIGGAYWDGDTD